MAAEYGPHLEPPADDTRSRKTRTHTAWEPGAALAVMVGAVLAVVFGAAVIGLVRETLHFNCSWGRGGEWGPEGSWVCADGIGYLGVAAMLGGMSVLLIVAGLLVAVARPSRGRSITFLALAAICIVWIAGWTHQAATFSPGPRPPAETGSQLWVRAILPAIAVCAAGLLVGGIGALTRQRWSPVARWSGVGLVVVGTALQPGIGIATLIAAGLLAAAGIGAPHRSAIAADSPWQRS